MSDERWRRLWELFHATAEMPVGERAAYLEDATQGDPGLRAEVEELLAAAARPGLTSAPRLSAEAADFDAGERVGEQVGPYRLVRQVGEGGMGIVFEAEQEEPIRRRVALKLVKVGMDTREVLARFEAERQALALMDHPNIARVFDAGASARGRPYFVMELVEGVRLTDYCDARRLDLDRRLDLFVPVCRAVEHAHRKSVLHRDLKPSNILVTEVDGAPIPKVIDFGLAKVIEQQAGDRTRTRLGGVLGTPEYMSPEQALGGPDVDTRADVYSLGVVLFELLAGRLPFGVDPPGTRGRAPRPSGSLSGFGAQADEIAQRRSTDAGALSRTLRGELDWIVQKALEPERGRRYGSAAELAADLERHRRHEPVSAAPPSTFYRAGRFVRRHRAAVAAAAVLVLLLTAFALHSAGQAAKLRLALEESRQVTRFLVDIFQVADPAKARGREISAREILDRGAARVESELRGQPQVQATLRHAIGVVYRQLGVYDRAEEFLAKALEQRRGLVEPGVAGAGVAETLRELGRTKIDRGDHAGAQEVLAEAVAQARRGVSGSELPVASALVQLAVVFQLQSKFAEAERALSEALAIQRSDKAADLDVARALGVLGLVQQRRGGFTEAEANYRGALDLIRRNSGEDDPAFANTAINLGALLFERGDVAAAELLYRDGLAAQRRVLGPEHPRIALTVNNLALLLHERGEYGEAEGLYEEALAINTKAHGEEHPLVAGNLNNLGLLFYDAGDFERAEPLFQRALAMQRRSFGPDHPNLGFQLNNLARLEHERGDLETADRLYRQGLEIRRRALPPGHPELAGSLAGLGSLLVERGDSAGGEALLREALAIRREKLRAGDWRTAEVESWLARCLAGQGNWEAAEELLRPAVEVLARRRGESDRRTVRAQAWLQDLQAARVRAAATPAPLSKSG